MPRKRVIDPDFWLDEELTDCSVETRLFYIATWNFSDDYGVIENSAKRLKAQVFPYDNIDVQPLIDKLVSIGKLLCFESEGKKWLYINKFLKWQRIDKPSAKRNPPSPFDDHSTSTQRPLVSEEKLREVKLSKEKRIKPENEISFLEKIPEEVLTALSEKYNASNEQIKSKAEDLVDYCRSRNKRYSNYLAFLRTALKKDFGVMTEQQKIERKRKEETVKLMFSKRTPVISVDKTQERPETREEKQNRDSFEKLKRTLPVVKKIEK